MKSPLMGTVALAALANVVASGVALAKKEGKPGKAAGWCKANSCKTSFGEGKNTCAGQEAKGVKKEECEKDSKGTWETGPKPK